MVWYCPNCGKPTVSLTAKRNHIRKGCSPQHGPSKLNKTPMSVSGGGVNLNFRQQYDYDPNVTYLTIGEMAEKSGYCKGTISKKISAGKLDTLTAPRRKRKYIHPDEAARFLVAEGVSHGV